MAAFILIDEADGVILRVAFEGLVTLEDLLAAHAAVVARREEIVGRRLMWDFRAAQAHALGREELRGFADYLRGRSIRDQLAGDDAIVVSRSVDRFVAQIWGILAEFSLGLKDRVFDDIEEARAWLRDAQREPVG